MMHGGAGVLFLTTNNSCDDVVLSCDVMLGCC